MRKKRTPNQFGGHNQVAQAILIKRHSDPELVTRIIWPRLRPSTAPSLYLCWTTASVAGMTMKRSESHNHAVCKILVIFAL